MSFSKQNSTIFLQIVIVLLAILALALLIRFPLTEGRAQNLNLFSIYTDPFVLFFYAASIPFFIGLYHTFRLLTFIGQNKAFSSSSVEALNRMKSSAIVQCILIVLAGIYIRVFHHKDDDPAGFLALCFIASFVSLIMATAVSLLKRILQNGIDLKLQ